MHHQREQTPLIGAKKTERARVGEQTPHNKPYQKKKRNPYTIARTTLMQGRQTKPSASHYNRGEQKRLQYNYIGSGTEEQPTNSSKSQ
jgi:hypothetical protein